MSSNDDDFVMKTTKHRKKAGNDQTPKKPPSAPGPAPAPAGSGNGNASASAEGISLRPRTMFAMKGRGRTESEGAAYRPQWSKDGEGFVSAAKDAEHRAKDGDASSRRKSKGTASPPPTRPPCCRLANVSPFCFTRPVLRYSREELLALHFATASPPKFPEDTPVASEHSLPPVGTLPFDYDEIYKQWSLNRNRGRGRGRGNATGTGNNQQSRGAHDRSRSEGKWGDDAEWDKHGKVRRTRVCVCCRGVGSDR